MEISKQRAGLLRAMAIPSKSAINELFKELLGESLRVRTAPRTIPVGAKPHD